ncbi:17627_t:CDS:10, partial [Acaulospora morrowiae]
TDHRREKAQKLLDEYMKARFTRSPDVQGSEPSHEASVEAYTTYEVVLRSRLRADLTLALLGRIRLTRSSYVQGTQPGRQMARKWDKERSDRRKSVEKLNEPSVRVYHPIFIGGGTVGGIIKSETFISGSSEKDQKKDPVGNVSGFFKDLSGTKSTKFIEKLWRLSDDSNRKFDEDKVESESQISSSGFDDNDSDYIPSGTDESFSDESTYDEIDDLDYNNDYLSKKDSPKIDKVAFRKSHDAIPDTTKLKLSTGKIVEDVLFDFCKDMDYEHHAHSYIVNFDDENVKALFTDSEWKELTEDRIGVPIISHDIAKELARYEKNTLEGLRIVTMTSFLKEKYDIRKHYDKEWIQLAVRTLVNLYENIDAPLIRAQCEHWYTVALLGTCIDFCLRDIRLGTDVKRIDAPSSSSADRKNRNRKANTHQRKSVDRKIDGIIHTINELLEFGVVEGARSFKGVSDNKYLNEEFEIPKTLREMYSNLIRAANYDDQRADKLQVIGILHLGLWIQFQGYINISEVKSLPEVEICEEINRDSDPLEVKIQMKVKLERETELVIDILKNLVANNGLVSVFVDNSNILVEGKYIAGYKEKADSFDCDRDSCIINQLHLDHGRLLSTILQGRKMGSDPVIVGSRPPPSDEIWSQARNLGFIVNVFDRNCENKEKMADTSLVAEGICVYAQKDPGTLILIAGYDGYVPLIDKALLFNWRVEIWFWSSVISGYLRSKGTFYCLDNYYKYFTYALGPCSEKKFILEITYGETIKNWRDAKILDFYVSLRLFGWWHKEENIIHMYFDDRAHLNDAKKWLEDKYSDSIRVLERERKRKNTFKK